MGPDTTLVTPPSQARAVHYNVHRNIVEIRLPLKGVTPGGSLLILFVFQAVTEGQLRERREGRSESIEALKKLI